MYLRNVFCLINLSLLLRNTLAAPAAESHSHLDLLDTRDVSTTDERSDLGERSALTDVPELKSDGPDFALESRSGPSLINNCNSYFPGLGYHFLYSSCTTGIYSTPGYVIHCVDKFRRPHERTGACFLSGCENTHHGKSEIAECVLFDGPIDCEIQDPDCECFRRQGYKVMACNTKFTAASTPRSLPSVDEPSVFADLETKESNKTAEQHREIAIVASPDMSPWEAEGHVDSNEAGRSSHTGLMKREWFENANLPLKRALEMVQIANVAAGVTGIILSRFPKDDALKFVTGVKGVFKKAVTVSGIKFVKNALSEIRWDFESRVREGLNTGVHVNLLIQDAAKRETWGIYLPQTAALVRNAKAGEAYYKQVVSAMTQLHFGAVISKIIANQQEDGSAIVASWEADL